ncbi:MAG: hypothetical protein HOL15_03250 [Nitrospinaceae bacterium]|jgi:hypothetical protein|nr:hypothetical protein [Nitrospinaceae bacterium]
MIDQDTIQRIIIMRAKGYSFAKISKKVKSSKPTLIKVAKDHIAQINECRDKLTEAMREKYLMSEMKQLKLFGKRLNEIKTEITCKGLKDLSIKQLLDFEGVYAKLLTEYKTPSG